GLATDPFSDGGVARIGRMKGRETPRAMLLLLTHTDAVHDLARVEGAVRRWVEALARGVWPGPLPLGVPKRSGLRCAALAGGESVAVRLSSHPLALTLVRTVGSPITSTSANLTGEPPAATAAGLSPALLAEVDMVLDGGAAPGGPPSTLLD